MISGLEFANLLKISDEELDFLTGGDDVAALWRERMELICVTYGSAGAVIHLRDGRTIKHDGYARHAFVAAMLIGILELR